MDFDKAVAVVPDQQCWVESPADGVCRIHLEREAAESGHTTSIVRFAPGASFPAHSHDGGEELLILDGVFSDEHGDYPAGTYLRNPPGSHHSPFTRQGCTLFVKLEQFADGDDKAVIVRPEERQWQAGIGGLRVVSLHDFGGQHTAFVHWPENEVFTPHTHWGGEEIFVISGEFIDEYGRYPAGSWLRNPHQSHHHPRVEQETLILVKVGHLPETVQTHTGPVIRAPERR